MASLYDPVFSNDQLLAQKNLRHRRINFDYEYISSFPHIVPAHLSSFKWQTLDFNKVAINTLKASQGIYMFVFNPYKSSVLNHSAKIAFYIGQADNLRTR